MTTPMAPNAGARRGRERLLQGLVICGVCGRRMTVRYRTSGPELSRGVQHHHRRLAAAGARPDRRRRGQQQVTPLRPGMHVIPARLVAGSGVEREAAWPAARAGRTPTRRQLGAERERILALAADAAALTHRRRMVRVPSPFMLLPHPRRGRRLRSQMPLRRKPLCNCGCPRCLTRTSEAVDVAPDRRSGRANGQHLAPPRPASCLCLQRQQRLPLRASRRRSTGQDTGPQALNTSTFPRSVRQEVQCEA